MKSITRRSFIKVSASTAGGLVLGVQWSGEALSESTSNVFAPNAWLRITKESNITFILGKTEMGQGVMTSLAMLVCEDLGCEPEDLQIEMAPVADEYASPD